MSVSSTVSAPVRRVPLGSRAAVVAVAAVFAANGVVSGGWIGVLPALRARLGIDAGLLAALLFAAGLAAVAMMQVGGRLSDRIGARTVTLAGFPVMVVGVGVLALTDSYPAAVVGACVWGLGNGLMDVSMNTLAVAVEARRPVAVMSRFHAFWSVGSLTGSAVVFGLARLLGDEGGGLVRPALLVIAVLAVAVAVAALRWVPQSDPVPRAADGSRPPVPRIAYLLGAMAVCVGLMEGTAYDWSGIHVADVAGVEPGTASIAAVVLTLFMLLIRLFGDAAVQRYGRRAVVRGGAVVASAGYVTTALVTPLPAVLVGWAAVGAGVALIAPQLYATSGHLGGGRMLSVVTTFGYGAFLVGPAILGWLVHTFGVQRAMLLPLVCAVVLVALIRWLPSVRHGGSEAGEAGEAAE